MRHILSIFICICFVLSIGMTTADSTPNLTGKWVEESLNCLAFSGEISNTTSERDYWIITQQDTIIRGTNVFYVGETAVEESIAGVISPDGKTVNIVDMSGGTYIGFISGDDTLTISYLNTGTKKEKEGYAFVLSEVLKRRE